MPESGDALDGFWAVIPAGGAGTRLWPLSRRSSPKFLHDLTGSGRTLLQATWDRLEPLTDGRVVVVTGMAHADEVARQLPDLPAGQLLAEPSPRDSMPAIGLAAAVVEQLDPDAVIGSFAADHVIAKEPLFHDAVREAVAVARTGRIVTLGIAPAGPSTAFGYIQQGPTLEVDGAPNARGIITFVEKPDAETAQRYLATGEYWWNAGMFVTGATMLLDTLARYDAPLVAGLRAIAADRARLETDWDLLRKIAIDHAVAEPASRDGLMAVVPAHFTWDDVGDFASLSELLETDGTGSFSVIGDPADVVNVGSTGLVAARSGRTVAVVGLDDVCVIDTPDAVLVVSRANAQAVKSVVDRLKETGRTDLT